jgi:hypothetical protein
MKNYEEIAYLRTESTFHIEKAYDKGYDRGYNDCKTELLEDEAKCHYQEGYNDGYRKGVERGKEVSVAEADCAYQCGMKRAWEAARKIVLSPKEGGLEATTVREIFGMPYESALMKYSAQNAIEMIDAWEKEQEQTEKNCENCGHHRSGDVGCEAGGCSLIRENWIPQEKQDAPEMNVGSIEVGDAVRMIGSDPKLDNCDFGVCTMVKPKTIYVMRMDGSVGEEDKEEWEKTGNHYDIQSILDKMKENEVKE